MTQINWNDIPDDVQAVGITSQTTHWYKMAGSVLMHNTPESGYWDRSAYRDIDDAAGDIWIVFERRPIV